MPVLWRAYDRHRDLRARLPAELAPDTDQDRHVMSQTSCERSGFPVPMRWLRAGGDLAQPNSIHQGTDRASIHAKHLPKGLLHPADLPYLQTNSSNPVSVTSIIELGTR